MCCPNQWHANKLADSYINSSDSLDFASRHWQASRMPVGLDDMHPRHGAMPPPAMGVSGGYGATSDTHTNHTSRAYAPSAATTAPCAVSEATVCRCFYDGGQVCSCRIATAHSTRLETAKAQLQNCNGAVAESHPAMSATAQRARFDAMVGNGSVEAALSDSDRSDSSDRTYTGGSRRQLQQPPIKLNLVAMLLAEAPATGGSAGLMPPQQTVRTSRTKEYKRSTTVRTSPGTTGSCGGERSPNEATSKCEVGGAKAKARPKGTAVENQVGGYQKGPATKAPGLDSRNLTVVRQHTQTVSAELKTSSSAGSITRSSGIACRGVAARGSVRTGLLARVPDSSKHARNTYEHNKQVFIYNRYSVVQQAYDTGYVPIAGSNDRVAKVAEQATCRAIGALHRSWDTRESEKIATHTIAQSNVHEQYSARLLGWDASASSTGVNESAEFADADVDTEMQHRGELTEQRSCEPIEPFEPIEPSSQLQAKIAKYSEGWREYPRHGDQDDDVYRGPMMYMDEDDDVHHGAKKPRCGERQSHDI